MTTLTDDIRAAATAAKASCDTAIARANAIDALPPSGGYAPLVWPTPINCLGGTVPNPITIVSGDGAPGGAIPEPYYSRRMANMPAGSVGIFGDSLLQATHENLISPFGVNFALGGLSLRRLVSMLRTDFSCMQTAGAGVLLCGANDISNITYYGARNASSPDSAATTVLAMFSVHLKPYLTGKWAIYHLLPCNESVTGAYGYNSQIAYINANIEAAMAGCAAQLEFVPLNPEFVDGSGNLKTAYHNGDGQHLSKTGSVLLAAGGNSALVSLGVQ